MCALALTVATTACASTLDKDSGGDHVRGKAVVVKLNETHDDSISADQGDHTDWKKLTLKATTIIDVNVYWDDPSVRAKVNVKDQFGGQVYELTHEPGERENHWKGMKLREGDTFLEVVAERGASVYTIELTSGDGADDGGGGDDGTPPPE